MLTIVELGRLAERSAECFAKEKERTCKGVSSPDLLQLQLRGAFEVTVRGAIAPLKVGLRHCKQLLLSAVPLSSPQGRIPSSSSLRVTHLPATLTMPANTAVERRPGRGRCLIAAKNLGLGDLVSMYTKPAAYVA